MIVLVTGHNGYLMRHLLPHINGCIIHYDGDVRTKKKYSGIDMIIHFASPSDSEDFKDEKKMRETIIEGTKNLLEIAIENDAFFVYASSQAVAEQTDLYGKLKFEAEQIIKANHLKHNILRIPRVYSKDKNKGLIGKLKESLVSDIDKDKIIEFILIEDFIKYTLKHLTKRGISEYFNFHVDYQHKSIKEIEKMFKLN